ncbi:MAG: SDR family NAD(P)-dependent oxidoreductase [Betaproteobacteria bacterium]|nr:SDR family NAD(P)-dependent oxidoreductase [Betaproteobacteria bacterium]
MNDTAIKNQIQSVLKPRGQVLRGKTALITGASSGIGLATAVRLALEGCQLNLVARRKERLNELKAELLNLNPTLSVRTFALDLTAPESIQTLLDAGAFSVDILVNNAGLALGLSHVLNSDPNDWEKMLSTNVNSAFRISQEAAKHMANNGGGDIVVLSSVAAHSAYENGAVYCASKHAVRAFHEALRLETVSQNIRVIMLSPGMVETEFSLVRFKGDFERAQKVYDGVEALDGGDIADTLVYALQLARHINIDELIIKPRQQGNPWKVHRTNP